MSYCYVSGTNYINSCHFSIDEYTKNVADSEEDNFTPVNNNSTSDSGWSTPSNGWATPSSGYGTPVGVGTPVCRRRILVESRKEEIQVYGGGSCPGHRNKGESIFEGKYFNISCQCTTECLSFSIQPIDYGVVTIFNSNPLGQ
jgi:hypothetical protein